MLQVEPGGHLYELKPPAPVQMTLGRGFCPKRTVSYSILQWSRHVLNVYLPLALFRSS